MKQKHHSNYIFIPYRTFESCDDAYPYNDLSGEKDICCMNEITDKLKIFFEKLESSFHVEIYVLQEKRIGNVEDLLNKKFLFYNTTNGVVEEYFLLTGDAYSSSDNYLNKKRPKILSSKEIIFSNDHDGLGVIFEFPMNSQYYKFISEYLHKEEIKFESWSE